MPKPYLFRISISKFKLKTWGLKDLALILFLIVVVAFLEMFNGILGFIINVFLIGLVLTLIDKSIEKEVNDWLASARCKINIAVENK